MGSLSIRRLDDDVIQLLRRRAAAHGVSMEEEARRILSDAVSAPDRLGDLALTFFGSDMGRDLELPERRPHEPLDFSDER